mmetsp:Transcript_6954/g.18655  ORF Transcript_6954/g.18655 Transcript_6954/m.18655 type:complete len:292 (-) Transcript_6954:385-1260(-)
MAGFAPLELPHAPELSLENALASYGFEVCFRCVQVRKMDVLSESDPYLVITDVASGKELFRSETETDDPNPNFRSKWRSPRMERDALTNKQLRFDVYDEDVGSDDHIGTYTATLADLIQSMKTKFRMDLANPKAKGYNGGLYAYIDPVIDTTNFELLITAKITGAGSRKVFARLCRGSYDIHVTPVHVWDALKGNMIDFEAYSTTFVDFLLGDSQRLFSLELHEGAGWKPGKCKLLGNTQCSLGSIGAAGSGASITWVREASSGGATASVNYSVSNAPQRIELDFHIALEK